jgi:hypothetical protein
MHPAVGAHDKADLHHRSRSHRNQKGIGRSQRLRQPGVLATCPGADMRNLSVFNHTPGNFPDQSLVLRRRSLQPQRRYIYGSCTNSAHREKKVPKSETRHVDQSLHCSQARYPKHCSRAFAGPAIRQHKTLSYQSIERSLSPAEIADVKRIAYFMLRLVAATPPRADSRLHEAKSGFKS